MKQKESKKPARLVFSENGTSVWIVFGNDKESFSVNTKEEALEMVVNCYGKDKITKEEMYAFLKEIGASEKMPSIIEEMYGIKIAGVALITESESSDLRKDIQPIKIQDPTFRLCDCGVGLAHGYIYDGKNNKCSNIILTKLIGRTCVEQLLNRGSIEESDTFGLNTLIELAKIPESENMN